MKPILISIGIGLLTGFLLATYLHRCPEEILNTGQEQEYMRTIERQNLKLDSLQAERLAIIRLRKQDSIENLRVSNELKTALKRITKKYNEINLENASAPELDSAVVALYGPGVLLTHPDGAPIN